MELKLEYDMLRLADHEQILAHLKVSARIVWTKAASVPHCRPLSTKISIIPQNVDTKVDQDEFEIRFPKVFDLGFKIPTVADEERTEHILAEKRLAYGLILQSNEENRKIEAELISADQGGTFDQSSYITPTIASVFAEHEILAYYQLRFIKIREFRIKLLRQMNFFRSIERRITLEMHNLGKVANSLEQSLADM
jgi:hypothetical protein